MPPMWTQSAIIKLSVSDPSLPPTNLNFSNFDIVYWCLNGNGGNILNHVTLLCPHSSSLYSPNNYMVLFS